MKNRYFRYNDRCNDSLSLRYRYQGFEKSFSLTLSLQKFCNDRNFIEEQSAEIVGIGWNHAYDVLVMLASGILLAAVVVLVGIITLTIRNEIERHKRISIRRMRFIKKKK